MQTLKYDLKLFVQEPSQVDLEAFIPIFHRWIQTRALEEVLIDVVDYRHVQQGPGVILVAHDAHYAIDGAEGRLGLLYSRRRETHPNRSGIQSVSERLKSVFHCALTACQRLEDEPALQNGLRFRTDALYLRLNDRLHAPNRLDTFAPFWGHLERFLKHLYAGSDVRAEYVADVKVPLTVNIQAADSPDVSILRKRLEDIGTAVGVSL